MRAVARLGEAHPQGARARLYGDSPWQAARIDGFLDTSLVFARDSQTYLLVIGDRSVTADIHVTADIQARARTA